MLFLRHIYYVIVLCNVSCQVIDINNIHQCVIVVCNIDFVVVCFY